MILFLFLMHLYYFCIYWFYFYFCFYCRNIGPNTLQNVLPSVILGLPVKW